MIGGMAIRGLIGNVTLLLALAILYDAMESVLGRSRNVIRQPITGIIVGGIGIALMLTPWEFSPGVVFDARSVLLSVSGLFFGGVPTLLAVLVTSAFRLYIGGAGALVGVAVIASAGAIGVAWGHRFHRHRLAGASSILSLFVMGLTVHVVMLLWMFLLGAPLSLRVLSQIALPVMVIFPAGTALLGWLLMSRRARYLAEDALRASEKRFRQSLENIPDVVVIYDSNLRIRYINEATRNMTGRQTSEFIGKRDDEIWPAQVYQAYLPTLQEALDTSEIRMVETELLLPDMAVASLQITCVPITDRAGAVHEILGITHDLTAQKRAEENIRQLNEGLEEKIARRTAELEVINAELDSFAYSVSHDLRAPLRAMNGFSEALLEEYGDGRLGAQAKDYVERIQAASQRMGELIEALLSLSRVTRQEMVRANVDMSALATEIATDLATRNPDREVAFSAQGGLVVSGDSHLLRIVLENLLGNAWKFTATRSRATVTFGECNAGDESILFVRDNGVGFDMNYRDKLFVAFQRLHSFKEFPGTGIGLTTVQRIVQRHGGRVWAEGELGVGATFSFVIPDGKEGK